MSPTTLRTAVARAWDRATAKSCVGVAQPTSLTGTLVQSAPIANATTRLASAKRKPPSINTTGCQLRRMIKTRRLLSVKRPGGDARTRSRSG